MNRAPSDKLVTPNAEKEWSSVGQIGYLPDVSEQEMGSCKGSIRSVAEKVTRESLDVL